MSLRPNPLSPGRASPFRRAESPSSSSTGTARPTTPTYQSTRPATPSRLNSSSVPNGDGTWSPTTAAARNSTFSTTINGGVGNNNNSFTNGTSGIGSGGNSLTPSSPGRFTSLINNNNNSSNTSTTFSANTNGISNRAAPPPVGAYNTEALAKLPAAQVRELREAFAILDREGSGTATPGDVAEMLGQLGLDSSERSVASYFNNSSTKTTTSNNGGTETVVPMSAFLSGIAGSLARLSGPQELVAALSAFDDDDSGQIDVAELADALATTGAPGDRLDRHEAEAAMQEFVGRRAFNKYSSGVGGGSSSSSGNPLGGRGDVFRYREWVAGLGPVAAQGEKVQAA